MRWTDIANNWDAFSAPILQRWPAADENALLRIEGEYEAFLAHIAEVTGQPRDVVVDDVARWIEGGMPADVVMDEHHDNASISQSADYVPEGEDPLSDDARFGDDNKADTPIGRS